MKPKSELILYQTEDNRTRIEVRLENETVWLTQKLMAELFQKDVRTVNEHIQNIFEEGELMPGATIRNFRIVQSEGARQVTREIEHYSLDVIIAVGYRVKSHRGTQFRTSHRGIISRREPALSFAGREKSGLAVERRCP